MALELYGWDRTLLLAIGGALGVIGTAALIHVAKTSGILSPTRGPGPTRSSYKRYQTS